MDIVILALFNFRKISLSSTKLDRTETKGHLRLDFFRIILILSILIKISFIFQFNLVHDLAKGPGGTILISDRENGRIQLFEPESQKIIKMFSNRHQIGPNVYASTYSPSSGTIFLGTL